MQLIGLGRLCGTCGGLVERLLAGRPVWAVGRAAAHVGEAETLGRALQIEGTTTFRAHRLASVECVKSWGSR